MRTRKWIKAYALLVVLLGASTTARAEGGCPSGQYPANGQGWQACYPIPGYQQDQGESNQPQAPQWKDQWLSIASDNIKKRLGIVTDMPDKASAEQAALSDCRSKGGTQCQIDTTAANGCAAIVAGVGGYNIQSGPTIDDAVRTGMSVCTKAGNSNCHSTYSVCSLPKRVQ